MPPRTRPPRVLLRSIAQGCRRALPSRSDGWIAAEQASLRRVATLVARGVAPSDLFSAVTEEVGRLLGGNLAGMIRFEADEMIVAVAAWSAVGEHADGSGPWPLDGDRIAKRILGSGLPVREDAWPEVDGPIAAFVRHELGVRSSVGSPIVVEGRVWGALFVHSTQPAPLPADTEARLGRFTQLVGTAMANVEARADLQRLADEQAALLRVAELVARGAPSSEVFATVAEELGRLIEVDGAKMLRYEPDETATFVACWGELQAGIPVGTRLSFAGNSVTARIFATGQPARVEDYVNTEGRLAALLHREGMQSAAGAPIVVGGRLWGALLVGSARTEPLPPSTEERIAGFAELVATAIANVEARTELAASRARVVAASDEARRRIERNLHDGVQQRLVSLTLALRGAQTMFPTGLQAPQDQLSRVSEGLTDVLEELRELSHGLHPAILSKAGLEPALRALGRRSAVPLALECKLARRLEQPVEVAAYYVVSEALANTAKHARATRVSVRVEASDRQLDVSIADDGIGGADPARGSGLIGLGDRVAALGGTIDVESAPGEGTSVHVALPLAV